MKTSWAGVKKTESRGSVHAVNFHKY
jgi:hypothetical protein